MLHDATTDVVTRCLVPACLYVRRGRDSEPGRWNANRPTSATIVAGMTYGRSTGVANLQALERTEHCDGPRIIVSERTLVVQARHARQRCGWLM